MGVSKKNDVAIQRKSWLGSKQVWIIFFAFVMNLFGTVVSAGTTNTVLPFISQERGWNNSLLLLFITFAGYAGVISSVVFGQMVVKKGAKFVNILGLIMGAVVISIYGLTSILPVFLIMILMNRICATAYQNQSMNTTINTWFPKKKGIVFSWVTMGIILSNIIWAPYIIIPMKKYGSGITMVVVGVIFLVFALLSKLFVKNLPEEAGEFPDGESSGQNNQQENILAIKNYQSPWTFKRLVKNKLTWQIAITWGVLWMLAVTFSSQTVPRIVSIGYKPEFGILVMQVSSFVGLFGKWIFGLIDQKIGTKKATLIYSSGICIMYIVALFMRVSPVIVWVSALGIMLCIGGITNLVPSIVGTVFGRLDFAAANRVIFPIVMFCMTSAYAITALFTSTGWGFDSMYIFCAAAAAICFVSVFFLKDKMIGTTNQELKED